jgi:hypothetical protein
MGDAAHAELLNHEVYRTPFAVRPDFQFRKTPHNYRYYHLGPDKLPDQMKVWLVQKTGKDVGGVVAWGDGFTDSPDAEILALGFNDGKAYGSVGIGRQGNFLQWGYSAPPSQMTDAGRTLFLNCIYYVRKFDGKVPLLRRRAGPRTHVVILARIINRIINEDPREFFLHTFPEELYEKYHADPNGLAAYYQANLELVYRDKVYRVDEELRSLALASNRKVETLERLLELRQDPARREIAQRLLDRYTDGHTAFDFQNGRDRIYFSDVGGYKFFVVPEGYLTVQNSGAGTSQWSR